MYGTDASTLDARTAHREWATRPPDERYDSVHALYEAARTRRLGTVERCIDTAALGTHAVTDEVLALRDPSGRSAALTHWSFEQLATIAGAPPKYLRSLPAPIASAAINHGMQRQRRDQHQLFVDEAAPWTVRAITSPRYTRVHHDELADRVLDLMASHPAWHLPLGYKDGVFGAARVPSGAYLGDRDMFLFLVDGNRDLDDPTDASRSGLFRGFVLRNSDVGAAALTLDVFLFRAVCANHHLGVSPPGRLQTPPCGHGDSGRMGALPGERPRGPGRRPDARSHDAPAGDVHRDRGDARPGARGGHLAARSAAEGRRGGVRPRGDLRGEPPVGLGLRAGADTTQPAHALAGRTVRAR